MKDNSKFKTVDDYFYILPVTTKEKLQELRSIIRETCPDAVEVISYNMPAYKYHGILVYYAAQKNHIGFYPANSTLIDLFQEDLQEFETSKGTIRFPYNKPLPESLIKEILKFRMSENFEKAKSRN